MLESVIMLTHIRVLKKTTLGFICEESAFFRGIVYPEQRRTQLGPLGVGPPTPRKKSHVRY